jgi:type IV secretion system protein VirB8
MRKLLEFFTGSKNAPTSTDDTHVDAAKSWFKERYESALIQRNLLVIIAACCVVAITVSVIAVTKISLGREFDPFVIQIEDTTGVARVVNPVSLDILSGKEELSKYFAKKYVVARETYNPVDFDKSARKVLRLLSTSQVYSDYLGYIKSKTNDPTIIYGQRNTTYLTVRSWSKLSDTQYMLRFSLNETSGDKKKSNKISVIEYQYVPMELTDTDREINPVGFQITGYRVDDDNS